MEMKRTKFPNACDSVQTKQPRAQRKTASRRNKYGLSYRQALFVDEYLLDLNASQAALRAGYSANCPGVVGHEVLNNPKVSAAIEQRMAELSARTGVNQERIIRELARVAFLDPTKLTDAGTGALLPDTTEDDRAAIQAIRVKFSPTQYGQGVEREVKFADKLRALELLGKYFSMWVDRQQVSETRTVTIVDDIPTPSNTEEDVPETEDEE